MPQFLFRNIEAETVRRLSTEMTDALERILACPRDYITLECLTTTSVRDGAFVAGEAMVQVFWFDRGQTVQDQVARAVNEPLAAEGYQPLDIVFFPLAKTAYYENGQHFG